MPRGRPPGSKNKPKQPQEINRISRLTRDNKPRKLCAACQKSLLLSKFYRSGNEQLHTDGFLPYCKECLVEMSLDPETHIVDSARLQNILRQCDKPWDKDILDAAIRECEDSYNPEIGEYEFNKAVVKKVWKNIQSLPQYNMSWQEYEDKKKVQANNDNIGAAQNYVKNLRDGILPEYGRPEFDNKPVYLEDFEEEDKFELTREVVKKFGEGYTKSEYKAMSEKYDFLSQSYPDLTNLHTEALITYIRYKVKEEFATSAGRVDEAEKWASLATKAADKAKINPSQLSQSDLQGGLNSFSELMMAIEQSVDIIPILPQFKFRPNDAVDFTIWCYVNYIRKAEGKPLCEYEDIYHFYDERKAEYIAQYGDPMGIFKDDPTEKNRDNVKRFITLPKDYSDSDG